MTARLDGRVPILRRLDGGKRALGAVNGDAAVSAGADAGVIVPPPIEQIVTRLRSRPRMVRDFVSGESRRLAKFLGEEILRPGFHAVRCSECAGLVARGERRAGLDRELIEREVVGGVAKREAELVAPGLRRLALARIDEVERDAAEMALGKVERRERLIGGVLAPERFQACVVERLHPEREPVDAGGTIAGEARRFDAGG